MILKTDHNYLVVNISDNLTCLKRNFPLMTARSVTDSCFDILIFDSNTHMKENYKGVAENSALFG